MRNPNGYSVFWTFFWCIEYMMFGLYPAVLAYSLFGAQVHLGRPVPVLPGPVAPRLPRAGGRSPLLAASPHRRIVHAQAEVLHCVLVHQLHDRRGRGLRLLPAGLQQLHRAAGHRK